MIYGLSMKRSLVTFDLDDTIIDTSDVVFKAFNDTLKDRGKGSISKDRYKEINFWSGDSKSALKEIGVEISPEEFISHYDVFFEEATKSYIDQGKIAKYPGVEQVFTRFKESYGSMAIVTNSPHKVALLKLEKLGIGSYFEHVITPKHVVNKKPSPEGILKAIEQSGSHKDRTVHIGDSSHDVEAAQRAGVASVKIGAEHEKADYNISEFKQLKHIDINL